MKLQIIYDNTTTRKDLKTDWGFAALIEAHNKTILFDTGADGQILLNNMHALNIDLQSITDVFISHHHFDHTGGLSHFLNENDNVNIHAPQSFRGVRSAKDVIHYNQPKKIYPGYYTTGELDNIEQALVVETTKGLLIVVGCSHPAMIKIISSARTFGTLYGIVGGLHGFDQYELFSEFEIICPTHCTQHIKEIKKKFPKAYIPGGAGSIITI
ncbi:MAG: MBL fold metallo-hydrolase [Calditrichaceae bacterium]|nr:MBL fold metallo-hydrolase [Calditrichaceae bacterium]MBN2708231.1 MBL fold metallo-hydrolase [Calditrichaceae bacterium]RQV92254.1 MAG: MBL fold metallo-hydrolase [Calditrichota bacterium]